MKILLQLLFALALAPITALINAWGMSTIYGWYVASTYGAGPSYAAWYGIGTIASLMAVPVVLAVINDTNRKTDQTMLGALGRTLGVWIAVPIVVGTAWLVGKVLGWL